MAKPRSQDLHGLLVEEAEKIFFKLLDESRLASDTIVVEFITGRGKIQTRFAALAKEHGLEHHIPLSNAGVIIVEFE